MGVALRRRRPVAMASVNPFSVASPRARRVRAEMLPSRRSSVPSTSTAIRRNGMPRDSRECASLVRVRAMSAWEVMCAPVKARYVAERGPNRARDIALRLLEWEARRRARPAEKSLTVDARILAVQPDHLGGVLAATPAFRLIKEALPTCELTVLAGPWGADAAEHCPAVDRVRTCRFPAFDRGPVRAGVFGRLLGKLAPYERAISEAS